MAGKKGVIIKALKLKFHYKKGKRNENEKEGIKWIGKER